MSDLRTGHASVNGLQTYYEIHGPEHGDAAAPVLLLNGAYMTTADFGPLLPGLAARCRVLVCDPQAHGRTGDVDRPLSYEGMADDDAMLLGHLGIEQADVVGFSMGGGTAIQSRSGTRTWSARWSRSRPDSAATRCSRSCSR